MTNKDSRVKRAVEKLSRLEHPLALVPALGALGGLAGLILDHSANDHRMAAELSSLQPLSSAFLSNAFLGAIAAVIFVFLISNTDRGDVARLCAVSLVAGHAWKPVLEAGKGFVTQGVMRDDALVEVRQARSLLEDAANSAGAAETEALVEEAAERIDTAIFEAARLHRPRDRAMVEGELQSLSSEIVELRTTLPAEALRDVNRSLERRALIEPRKPQ